MTTTPKPEPASDAAIVALAEAARDYRAKPGRTPLDNLVWGIEALIARIDSDRARIRELEETVTQQVEDIKALGHDSMTQTRRAIGLEEELAIVRGDLSRLLTSVEKADRATATARGQLADKDEQIARLRDALIRLRDCDWTISLPDRMDAVRDIARAALAEKPEPR